MLTRQAPFADPDPLVVMVKVERGEFIPPREVNPPGVDGWGLEAILHEGNEPAFGESICCRYCSAGIAALPTTPEHWLSDQPVSAFIEPLTRRQCAGFAGGRNGCRRHRLALMSVAGLSVHDFRLGQEQVLTKAHSTTWLKSEF